MLPFISQTTFPERSRIREPPLAPRMWQVPFEPWITLPTSERVLGRCRDWNDTNRSPGYSKSMPNVSHSWLSSGRTNRPPEP